MSKISILGLHLGFGGVEQSIITQANILSAKHDVELVITYKVLDKPAFQVNPNVKITYLTNLKPNKKEFLAYLHSKKFLKCFKEGLLSLKILYLKNKTMKKYLQNCDSDIIISSRVAITKILNKVNPKAITITEEHRHHNNDPKYINNLKKACSNINYLVAVSKELTDFYEKEIPTTKCIHIPNSLDNSKVKPSTLKNKNLISVGRLSPEKGFSDLIDVFALIHEQDSEVSLHIIGDGAEYENLKTKIDNLKLQKFITLHGFKTKPEINELLSKSSLYLMCSYEESFGIVLIEAGACCIPALAFDSATGASEIIENHKSGLLIKNRDKKLMAKETINLLNDRERLKQYGQQAAKIANNYSYEKTRERWLKFIEEVTKC